jgi:hypothetical protein
MVRHIARALHVNTRKEFGALLDDVVSALDPNKLVIMDEIHLAATVMQAKSFLRCIETLRYIFNQSGCGMLLCGTDVWRHEMEEGQFKKLLVQMKRRALYEVRLPDVLPAADRAMVLREFGLEAPKGEAAKVWDIVIREGFGMMLTRLEDARMVAQRKGEELTWDHFLRAVDLIEQMARGTGAKEEEAA